MKRLFLKKGKYALVDDDDFEVCNRYKWTLTSHGYVMRKLHFYLGYKAHRYIVIYLHRFILGVNAGEFVDHINHNGLDNRKNNIRLCTKQQNQQNQRVLGIHWDSSVKTWKAQIVCGGRKVYLGSSVDKSKALKIRKEGIKKYFGEFACN